MTNLKGKDFNIDSIMCELQNKRKVFHSEDDLKFSLATVIQRQYKYAEVRLERPMKIEMVKRPDGSKPILKKISIDITVFLGNDVFYLELKYKTKKISKDFDKKLAKNIDIDYEFNLTNQQAQPISRFLFRKDIYRLEKLIEISKNKGLCKGYFIVITNDNKYEMKEENLFTSLNLLSLMERNSRLGQSFSTWGGMGSSCCAKHFKYLSPPQAPY